jgi:hypothetical protein
LATIHQRRCFQVVRKIPDKAHNQPDNEWQIDGRMGQDRSDKGSE